MEGLDAAGAASDAENSRLSFVSHRGELGHMNTCHQGCIESVSGAIVHRSGNRGNEGSCS